MVGAIENFHRDATNRLCADRPHGDVGAGFLLFNASDFLALEDGSRLIIL